MERLRPWPGERRGGKWRQRAAGPGQWRGRGSGRARRDQGERSVPGEARPALRPPRLALRLPLSRSVTDSRSDCSTRCLPALALGPSISSFVHRSSLLFSEFLGLQFCTVSCRAFCCVLMGFFGNPAGSPLAVSSSQHSSVSGMRNSFSQLLLTVSQSRDFYSCRSNSFVCAQSQMLWDWLFFC